MLKNVFCLNCTQRGHLFSECKEKKAESKNGNVNGNGKPDVRHVTMHHEEAPTFDTLAGMLTIVSHPEYV